jgi:RNA polymerase sigma-70 factor (family 1)
MHSIPDDRFTDWTRRLRAGDATAMEQLFRAAYPGLLGYARSIIEDEAQAQDAVQDAFIAVWSRRDTLDPARSLRALLCAAVRHRLLNRMRDVTRRRDLHEHMPAPDRPPTPDLDTEASLLGERLRGWIDELPARRREAFVLSRFEGLSHAEIADVMGLSAKTVEHHVGHALRHLRDRLRTHAPDALPS